MFKILRSNCNKSKNFVKYKSTIGGTKVNGEKVGIIGVPLSYGQGKFGVHQAPELFRKKGLIQALSQISDNRIIRDYGDLEFYPEENIKHMHNTNNCCEVVGCTKALSKKIQEILRENDRFLTIGGDHAISLGSVAGHLMHNPNISLIWIDAHADINLDTTTPSGNMHGMPVSLLIEELTFYWDKVLKLDWVKNRIPAKKIAYIGLRAVDPYERALLHKLSIPAFGMDAIDKHGIQAVLNMAMKSIDPDQNSEYHVSFDIDVLDPIEAPSTGTPVYGGLTLRESIYILEKLSETGRLTGLDLVEVNPAIGNEENVKQTLGASFEILKAAFGNDRLGNNIYIHKLNKLLDE